MAAPSPGLSLAARRVAYDRLWQRLLQPAPFPPDASEPEPEDDAGDDPTDGQDDEAA